MKNRKRLLGMTGILTAGLLMCFGLTAFAAPAVEGTTELKAVSGEVATAEFTVTSDEEMEQAELMISYDKEALTYMSGNGGDSFSGSGGNGTVQLTSKPDSKEASFTVKFRGRLDGDTVLTVSGCVITVSGEEIDVLTGENLSEEEEPEEEGDEAEDSERASFVIDERTFYVRRPDDLEGFSVEHLDIQGIDSRVLKHNTLDVYVVKLRSDNGSYRDNFVYNPETGNVIPYVQMESGTDDVIFLEPEEDVHIPTRYSYVDIGWGAKYTIPGYKHYTVDGVDEIPDDTNRYLIWGINQDGEKAWYSFDYDHNSLQLFDDFAYQGEQNYITELEVKDAGLRSESAYQLERYNRDMERRLMIILVLTLLVILLVNVLVFLCLKLRKLQNPEEEQLDEEEEEEGEQISGEYITGSLEENETDFREPEEEPEELEIIDLDDSDEE